MFRSRDFAPRDRADATRTAMQEQSVPSRVVLEHPDRVDALMQVWGFGEASIFRSAMTGYRLLRTPHQVRSGPAEVLAIAVQEQGTAYADQFGTQRVLDPGRLFVIDLNDPYDYLLPRFGSSQCLHVPIDAVGLPHDVVRAASDRLAASPLYTLVGAHIGELTRRAEHLTLDPSAPVLGRTGIELVRALLASAYDTDYARGPMAEVLLPRVRAYVRRHLGDPALSPERIARAHDISIRRLFRLCSQAGFSLEQWIIAERLDGARAELARPENAATPIAAVARRWGFVNNAHFSRRFRDTFGVSPREWRRIAPEEAGGQSTQPCGTDQIATPREP
ncbi:helix-turn-helix domain-containing protein [Nocardia takedensis]|uniref:helix-turn-helix domain-containing protein n=1 Tax=Nocardia takedensis TaxID=259390 RepID=UPI001FDF522C|nr:helix-turn-helix domain-containing protein [Nocardia takedensis]